MVGHQRSKRKARPLATTWTSECRLCGERIVRIKRRQWILMRDAHRIAAALWGPTFARSWPADRSFCFDELLAAIEGAGADAGKAR